MMRIGSGWDSHRLVAGRPLILGGVSIPFPRGLAGHSDADVLLHALIDALFGAAALGDIGSHFPDTEEAYRGANSLQLLRLFNDPMGLDYLVQERGLDSQLAEKLSWLGISGIANVLCCIKFAQYYELTENDVVATVLTDSADMYRSRISELEEEQGAYDWMRAAVDHNRHMLGLRTDALLELTYRERKRIHNLKYYTWIEQQGKDLDELNAQWYDAENYWGRIHAQAEEIDRLIDEFNEATGLLQTL